MAFDEDHFAETGVGLAFAYCGGERDVGEGGAGPVGEGGGEVQVGVRWEEGLGYVWCLLDAGCQVDCGGEEEAGVGIAERG
jgi:hypothetical protein